MATIDDLVTQGSVMPDNLRSDTARASLEYKNQLKNAGDIYVGTGTKITNDEAGVTKEIYVTEGKNIQTALNEDIFRAGGKNNIGLTNSDLSGYSNNIGIGKDISVQTSDNIIVGNSVTNSGTKSVIMIGNNSSTDNSSITIGNRAKSIGYDSEMITIGNDAENNGYRGIVIGHGASIASGIGMLTTGVALGFNAKVNASEAVQIGTGTNSIANSLQFKKTQIVDGDGHINATKINGVLSTDIFESDGKAVKDATNVTGSIGGRAIDNIFVGETAVVKNAENLTMTIGDPYTPVYFTRGVPGECAVKYYMGRGWNSNNNQVRIPYSDISFYNDGKKWLLITLPTVSNKVTIVSSAATNNIEDIKVVQATVNHYLLSQSYQTTRSFSVAGVADSTYTISVDSQGVLIKGPDDKEQAEYYKYTFPYVMVQFIKESW